MKHIKITAFDCPDAWFQALNNIWNKGDSFQVGYGSEITETKKLNLSIEINHPENRPLISDKAPCDMKYIQWYALAYLWCGEKQDETYTYGSRIREPVTLAIRLPEDIKKKLHSERHEPPCLSIIDTEILDDKMHLTCYFRSWDAYAGLPANIAGLQIFNEAFVSEINDRSNMSLKTGKLIFHSKNCHIYNRQNNLVKELLRPEKTEKKRNS